jgi:hypothetical protein
MFFVGILENNEKRYSKLKSSFGKEDSKTFGKNAQNHIKFINKKSNLYAMFSQGAEVVLKMGKIKEVVKVYFYYLSHKHLEKYNNHE